MSRELGDANHASYPVCGGGGRMSDRALLWTLTASLAAYAIAVASVKGGRHA